MTPPVNIVEILEQIALAELRTKRVLGELAEGQVRTDKALADLMRTSETFTANVNKYVEAADARMKHIEESLDALIRIITSEHSNGKAR